MKNHIDRRLLSPKIGSRDIPPLQAKGFIQNFLIILLLVLMTPANSAQAAIQGEIEWSQTYGDLESNDLVSTIIQTSDGGFVLMGTRGFNEQGDAWLFKIRGDGNKAWERAIGGSGGERANAGIQTSDGGFALACVTSSYGAGMGDFWLVKTDADGVTQWSQTYGGAAHDWPMDLIQLADGGFLLVGYTQSFGAGGEDGWVVRTDAQGATLWTQTYGLVGKERFNTVHEAKDGSFVLGGEVNVYGDTSGTFAWFSKMNTNGILQWSRLYGGANYDFFQDIIEMPDGSFFLVGSTHSFGNGKWDGLLVKTDANGIELWQQAYGWGNNDGFNAGIRTTDGGLVLAGRTTTKGGNEDMWLVKATTSGTVDWMQTYDNHLYDACYAVTQAQDGGLALAGKTNYPEDAWVLKTIPVITATGPIIISFSPVVIESAYLPAPATTTSFDISKLIVQTVTLTTTDAPVQTGRTTPVTSQRITSESRSTTSSETSQALVTVTVPNQSETPIAIPGFTLLPVFLSLLSLGLLARKRKK